ACHGVKKLSSAGRVLWAQASRNTPAISQVQRSAVTRSRAPLPGEASADRPTPGAPLTPASVHDGPGGRPCVARRARGGPAGAGSCTAARPCPGRAAPDLIPPGLASRERTLPDGAGEQAGRLRADREPRAAPVRLEGPGSA